MTGMKKYNIWLPLLFALLIIGGMYFGYQLNDRTIGKKGFFSNDKRSSLQEVLDLIMLKYVDSVKLDTLSGHAIELMMNQLDPHSVYIPASLLNETVEDLSGNFDGIGVEFNIFSDTVNVMFVIPGGPSEKAGLVIGDKILKVDNKSLLTEKLNSDDIKRLIRGKKDSDVSLEIFRNNKLNNITVRRGKIPVSSIDAAYMLTDTVGYIRLNRFSEKSYAEFMQSLEQLQKEGLQHLVFDLRGNGGGFMNEAVEIADEFLDNDKLIVYTSGTNSQRRDYRAKRKGLFETGKLVILVDELSASASEVLSGALQDWERATIVGRRTFGKGLVQEQYAISDGAAIRLTVARYYTPLGRSIQRAYDKGKKVYMDELWERYSNGESINADSNKINNGKEFKTRSGKIVYGGGGIMPDIFVPLDTGSYQRSISRLLTNGTFNRFVYEYFLQNQTMIEKYNSAADYTKNFNNSTELWAKLKQYVSKDSINFDAVPTKDKQALQKRLKALLARFKWRNEGFYEVLNTDDSVIVKALDLLQK